MGDHSLQSTLTTGLRALRPVLATAVIFGLFINLLLFVSPLYMLQIYDRVIPNGALPSLIALSVGMGLAIVFVEVVRFIFTSQSLTAPPPDLRRESSIFL